MQDYVSRAESVIKTLVQDRRYRLTTSKIRNILTLVSQIYNDVVLWKEEKLSDEITGRILHLKVRMVYEAGRDRDVKTFIEKAQLINEVDKIGSSKESFMNFAKYMEALVAYHRYHVSE